MFPREKISEKTPIHGQYQLQREGQWVLCDYSDGFNIAGVQALTQDLLDLTSDLASWVLYQRPDATAGIAHDAIEEMMAAYVALQQQGCLAVGILERSIFVRAGEKFHPATLTMPIRIEKDEAILTAWLQEKLQE